MGCRCQTLLDSARYAGSCRGRERDHCCRAPAARCHLARVRMCPRRTRASPLRPPACAKEWVGVRSGWGRRQPRAHRLSPCPTHLPCNSLEEREADNGGARESAITREIAQKASHIARHTPPVAAVGRGAVIGGAIARVVGRLSCPPGPINLEKMRLSVCIGRSVGHGTPRPGQCALQPAASSRRAGREALRPLAAARHHRCRCNVGVLCRWLRRQPQWCEPCSQDP